MLTGCISVPSRYIHSAVGCVHLDDVDRAADLIVAFIAEISANGRGFGGAIHSRASEPLPMVGNDEMRSRAAPMGMSVISSTGSLDRSTPLRFFTPATIRRCAFARARATG